MNKFYPFVLLLLFVACSSSDEQTAPSESENETSTPTLSVTDLTNQMTIETYTDIEVTVTDDSDVTTRIYINDEQVFATEELQFAFRLDPYTIPVGAATVHFSSVDADNNTVEQTFDIDLKHLVLTTDVADYQINGDETIWDMVHGLDGNILAAEKLVLGLNKIYTDEIVEDGEIYYSRVYYENSDALFRRVATAYTYTMGLGEHRNVFDEVRENLPNANIARLTLNGFPESDYITYYDASGTKYETNTFGSGSNGTSFEFTADTGFENTTDKLFYTNQSWLVVEENGGTGKKEDYRYFIVENPQDGMNIVLEEEDFSTLTSSFRLDLPQTGTSFSISRFGFETDEDIVLKTYNNHRIFSHGNTSVEYVDLPIFDMFKYYRNYINYLDPVTEYRNTFVMFGNEFDINEISGQITFEASGKVLTVATTAQDTDALRIAYGGTDDNNGDNYWDSFNWYYRLDPRKGEQRQVILSLPQVIKDDFANNFLFDQELQLENVDVIDYQKIADYDDFISTFILEERNDPLENGYRIKALSNISGTNNKSSRKLHAEILFAGENVE